MNTLVTKRRKIVLGVLLTVLAVAASEGMAGGRFAITYYDNYNYNTGVWDAWGGDPTPLYVWNAEYLVNLASGKTVATGHYRSSIGEFDLKGGFLSLDGHMSGDEDWNPLKSVGDNASGQSAHHVFAAIFTGWVHFNQNDVLTLTSDDDAYVFLDDKTDWGEEILSIPHLSWFESDQITIPAGLAGYHWITVKYAERQDIHSGIEINLNGKPLRPVFPFCADEPEYCQKKVAQVPLPWQFWAIDELGNVIDRIRISPTWLDPPPGQPPGEGPILVRRQVAILPGPGNLIPLEQLVWDPRMGPVPVLGPDAWEVIDEQPVEVEEGTDLELLIPVGESDGAVLVAYEVMAESGETAGHFINEAILESKSPQAIVQIMVNFDVHNNTGFEVTNFELDFLGMKFDCLDVRDAIGFVVQTGEPWGANAGSPLVVRPIPGGTEVKWIQPDRPLKNCEWLHVGLVFDCYNFDCFNPKGPTWPRATVQGYWTTIVTKNCDPRTQGFWKRICDGATGAKRLHPETPEGFDGSLCAALQVTGKERSDPCVRAKAQFAALLLNVQYDYLTECCEVVDLAGRRISVREAVAKIQKLIDSGRCKEAADLAESINSGEALVADP